MTNDSPERIPPHSIEAEQSVIGALLLDNTSFKRIDLSAKDFYRHDHQIIFTQIAAAYRNEKPFDAVTLGEVMTQQNIGDGAYLIQLASNTPSAANISAYAEIVKDRALKRQLIDTGTDIVNKGFNCASPSETTAHGMTELLKISARAEDESLCPIDLFADYAYPVIKQEWLPPGVADYAWDQAEIIGMPPEMLAMGCLGAICAAMSDSFHVKVKRNEPWFERSRLWIMVIAPPGSKKSLALKKPMAPLAKIESEMLARNSKARGEYEEKSRIHAEMQRAVIKRKAKGEGLDESLVAPERIQERRIMVNNATTEKLGEIMMDNPRGIHWYSDELAVWFGQHDAYARGSGGQDRGMALQAFDGGKYVFDRIGRGTVVIDNFSYSLLGTTQPDKIKAVVKNMSDDGLLQRFITIETPEQVLYGNDDRMPNQEYADRWDECIQMMWAWGENSNGAVIHMDDEAQAIRDEFSKWITRVSGSESLPAMMRGHIAKWEGIFPRLLLCYHAFGCAQSKQHIKGVRIGARTAQRVVNFMKGYLMPNAMRFFGGTVANSDPSYKLARKIGSMILANNMLRVTNRDLQRSYKSWRDAAEWQKISAIKMLKESGWLTGDDGNRSSNAEAGWIVTTAVHRMFGERALIEKAKRQETAATLRELRALALENDD